MRKPAYLSVLLFLELPTLLLFIYQKFACIVYVLYILVLCIYMYLVTIVDFVNLERVSCIWRLSFCLCLREHDEMDSHTAFSHCL